MEKGLIRYWIFLKSTLRNRMMYIVLILMFLTALLLKGATVPDNDNARVLLFGEDEAAEELIDELIGGAYAFSFEKAESAKQIEDEVRASRAECGFIFEKGFENEFINGTNNPCISFVSTPYTAKGFAAREKVFAVLLDHYSVDFLDRHKDEIFNDGEEAMQLVDVLYDKYRNSDDVFSVRYVGGEISKEDSVKKGSLTVHSVMALFLVLYALLLEAEMRFGKESRAAILFFRSEGWKIMIIKNLAALTPVAAAGLIGIEILEPVAGFPRELLLMLLLTLYTAFWCHIAGSVFRKEEGFINWLLAVMFLSIAATPVIWDAGRLVPFISKIACILPNGLYVFLAGR